MSTTHTNLVDALVPHVAKVRHLQSVAANEPPKDAALEDFFSIRRELKSCDIEGLGRIYFFTPQNVTERDAYHKHVKFDGQTMTVSLAGMVDGIIARVRTREGAQRFNATHRQRLFDMPSDLLLTIWNALGEEAASALSQETVDVAAKK